MGKGQVLTLTLWAEVSAPCLCAQVMGAEVSRMAEVSRFHHGFGLPTFLPSAWVSTWVQRGNSLRLLGWSTWEVSPLSFLCP